MRNLAQIHLAGISEGLCSIIHAAPRTELKGKVTIAQRAYSNKYFMPELHILRDILMHKYGREFSVAVMENRDGCVSERVRPICLIIPSSHGFHLLTCGIKVSRKLSVATPSPELVDAYLAEIAKAYGVPWSPPSSNSIDHGDSDGGVKVSRMKLYEVHIPRGIKLDISRRLLYHQSARPV